MWTAGSQGRALEDGDPCLIQHGSHRLAALDANLVASDATRAGNVQCKVHVEQPLDGPGWH